MKDNPVFDENQKTHEVVLKRFYQIRDEYTRTGTWNREEGLNEASTTCWSPNLCSTKTNIKETVRRAIHRPKVDNLHDIKEYFFQMDVVV